MESVWPAQTAFIARRLAEADEAHLAFCNETAAQILKLVDDLDGVARDYRFGAEMLFKEEVYFRRTGQYRRSTAAEVARDVYADSTLMGRYFRGLLVSQVMLPNHARVLQVFRDEFLPGNVTGYRHLDIGPGHGLMLALSASDPRCGEAAAWERSPEGRVACAQTLTRLDVSRDVALESHDATAEPPSSCLGRYDSLVLSELLEHLENPADVLARLSAVVAPRGRVFINVPLSSPAPDHITLFRKPEEISELVTAAGFDVERTWAFPQLGYTLERALRDAVTVSCVVIGRRS